MIGSNKYSKYNYGFPSDDISPEKKAQKEYCLAFSEAFLSMYYRNEFETTWLNRDEMFILRKYGVGDQDESTAQGMCYGLDSNYQALRKGWMNVNWAILKIAQKYRNAYLGMMSKVDFEIRCDSQDQYSKKEKEDKAWSLYVQKRMRPTIAQNMGVQLPEAELPEPDSVQELGVYIQLGFYKNAFELASEKYLKEVFSTFSNWEIETKRMIAEDLWDIGKAVAKDTLDRVTQKFKVEYCDIANSIIRRDHEGRILDGGVIKILSISDVRAESAACGQPISEDELIEAGMACCGYFGNAGVWAFNRDEPLYDKALGRYVYDNWKVAILDCEYRTSDISQYTEKTKNEKKTYYREKFDPNLKDTPTKKRIAKAKINYYRNKLLIGTKHCYDYGMQYDLPRPSKSEAHTSFHYIKLPGFSPVKTIREVLDQVQLAWTKFQNAWAKAKPDGWMYDESVLLNSTLGSKLKPDELVRMSEQTGRLFVKTVDKWKHPTMSPNAGNPIQHMPGGIGSAMEEFVNTWNLMISMLNELTGITPPVAAAPQSPDMGKAVTEYQVQATNNIIQPIVDEYAKLKKSIAKNALLRGLLTFQYSEEICKDYYDILGKETVDILKMCSKSAAEIGVNLVPRTSAELRQELKQAAALAMQSGRDGVPQLTLPEYLTLINLIDSSVSPDYIRGLMAKMITDRQMKEEQNKQALIELQNQGNQQAALVATEGEKEKFSFETQEKMKFRAFEALMVGYEEKMKTENQLDLQSGLVFVETALQNFMPPPPQGGV